MHIFIDETGNFTAGSGWGAVCALSLPHREVGRARRSIEFAARSWPRVNGELKGGSLSIEHLTVLVDLLFQRDALLHICAIDVAAEDLALIETHKKGQCEGITKYLAPTHQPSFVASVQTLRASLERMSQQLYIQCVVMRDLVTTVAEEATIYFSQRRPKEIGCFEWSVDAKDPLKETSQERWWRDTLGPLLESHSVEDPMRFVQGDEFDYRYFHKAYEFEKEFWFPDRPRETLKGIDIKRLFSNNTSFNPSHSDILLQAIDILASFTRRILQGRGTEEIARALGRLQIIKRRADGRLQNMRVLSLSREGKSNQISDDVARLITIMAGNGRSMLRPQKGRH